MEPTSTPTLEPTGPGVPQILPGLYTQPCETSRSNPDGGGFLIIFDSPFLTDSAKPVLGYRLSLESITRNSRKTVRAGIRIASNSSEPFCFDADHVCDSNFFRPCFHCIPQNDLRSRLYYEFQQSAWSEVISSQTDVYSIELSSYNTDGKSQIYEGPLIKCNYVVTDYTSLVPTTAPTLFVAESSNDSRLLPVVGVLGALVGLFGSYLVYHKWKKFNFDRILRHGARTWRGMDIIDNEGDGTRSETRDARDLDISIVEPHTGGQTSNLGLKSDQNVAELGLI